MCNNCSDAYANVPTNKLPGWCPDYARCVVAEDGLVVAYGDYYAARLGYYSVRHMLLARLAK